MRYRPDPALEVPMRLVAWISLGCCLLAVLLNGSYFSAVLVAMLAFGGGYMAGRLGPSWSPRRKRRGRPRRRKRGRRRPPQIFEE